MNFYKKIIRSKKLRFRILSFLQFIPDREMLYLQYFIKMHRWLDLKKPIRYTEKIQWYKTNYRDIKMQICADKYKVREYIKSKNLDRILNDLYEVYESPEEIELDKLPDKFVLKTNNGSGTNIICDNKEKLSREVILDKFKEFKKQTEVSAGREWVYKNIKPFIIAERYLEESSCFSKSLVDYKILCFSGKPEYIVVDVDRFDIHKRDIYDVEWKKLDIETDCPKYNLNIPRPTNLEEMLEIARILSEDFPAVRVDLYNIDGKIIFGELTFFPWSGYVQFTPDDFDYILGEKFILPKHI